MMKELTTLPHQQTESDSQDDDLYSDTVYLNAVNNKSGKQWHITALVDKILFCLKWILEPKLLHYQM